MKTPSRYQNKLHFKIESLKSSIMLFSFFKEHLDSYYEISDSQLLHSSYQADNKNNRIRSVMCHTETYWCLGATVSFFTYCIL